MKDIIHTIDTMMNYFRPIDDVVKDYLLYFVLQSASLCILLGTEMIITVLL